MSTLKMRSLGIVVAAIAIPLAAVAEPSVVNTGANLRAGPGANYPVVAQLRPGVTVDVQGCTAGYQWCDVLLPGGGLRGWVFARSLSAPYQGQPVPLTNYGATIGIPLITFAIGTYWGAHYRDRPFYREPRYWGGRPPPLAAGHYGRPDWDRDRHWGGHRDGHWEGRREEHREDRHGGGRGEGHGNGRGNEHGNGRGNGHGHGHGNGHGNGHGGDHH